MKSKELSSYKKGDKALIHCGKKGKGFWVAIIKEIKSSTEWVIRVMQIPEKKYCQSFSINPYDRKIFSISQ